MTRILFVGLAILAPLAPRAEEKRAEPFRIVGYLPDYRAATYDFNAAKGLTDLIIFSSEATPKGDINLGRLKRVPWEKLREFKARHRVRLILCVGGWGRSSGFAAVATSAEKRAAFAQSALRLCQEQKLDGVDLDWEHPKNGDEQQGYADLLVELRKAFHDHGLRVSVTMAGWQKLPKHGFDAVDGVQLMAYDHGGKHSTFEAAKAEAASLIDRGVSRNKIVLGVPFYGRHVKTRNRTMTYREIVAKHHPEPDADEVDGMYFNGPATIRRKTDFAVEAGLGGVMIWELGQDADGEQSLLRVIRQAVDGSRAGSPNLLFEDDFSKGMDRWKPTDAKAWKVIETKDGKALSQFAQSKYKTKVRSPFNYALINDLVVGDFVLEAKVKSTVKDYGHRDMCLFFGWQNPEKFYYVHLAKKADDHANQVFIVNDKPREKISKTTTDGTNWTDGWHNVKVVRKVGDGSIEVYFDDMNKPVMTASDKTFTWGQVGVGSFDDTGDWREVKLSGVRVKGK